MKENHFEKYKIIDKLMIYKVKVNFTQSSYQNHLVLKITDIENDSFFLSLVIELLRNLKEHESFHEKVNNEHMTRSTYFKTTFNN